MSAYRVSEIFAQTALAYTRVWHHVDASDRVLGKLAERIATVLMGKHKPIYDPGGTSLLLISCEITRSTCTFDNKLTVATMWWFQTLGRSR